MTVSHTEPEPAAEPERGLVRAFLADHGVTRAVATRLAVVVAMLVVIGIRFERTIIALAISAVFVGVFTVLGRGED